MSNQTYSFLALGDSYTIGESLPLNESFPYQTVQLLRKKEYSFYAPEIIAKTGFTTFELAVQIQQTNFLAQYDFVTLLIGVNNQYRGLSADEYKDDFELLLQKAIGFTGGKHENVTVISIPDWGVTPFGKDRGKAKITEEITLFNSLNYEIAGKYKTNYINITENSRHAVNDMDLVAEDGLHPSGKEYAKWAGWLADNFEHRLL